MTSFFFLIGTVLTQSIQMELSKKQKSFSEFFSASSVFRLNFEQFEKKDDPHSLCIWEFTGCERRA